MPSSKSHYNKKTKKVLDITDEENDLESAEPSGLGLSFLGND